MKIFLITGLLLSLAGMAAAQTSASRSSSASGSVSESTSTGARETAGPRGNQGKMKEASGNNAGGSAESFEHRQNVKKTKRGWRSKKHKRNRQ